MPIDTYVNKKPTRFCVSQEKLPQIRARHFRKDPKRKPAAGVFCHPEFTHPEKVVTHFLAELVDAVREVIGRESLSTNRSVSYSFTFFDADQVYGWSEVVRSCVQSHKERTIKPFRFADGGRGVKFAEDSGIRAPLSHEVTIAFEVVNRGDALLVNVFDMYPGPDYGDTDEGNISQREGVMFFRGSHPGEPFH